MTQKAEFCKSDIVKVDMNRIERIKCMVEKDGICRRYRLCMHDSPDNALQEMFICRHIGDYCRPDKHFNIPESHTIIEGSEAIILFDDFGGILDLFILDRSDGYLSYRIDNGVYHMTVPLTECAVDLEVKLVDLNQRIIFFLSGRQKLGMNLQFRLFGDGNGKNKRDAVI